nr:hypothetical protein [Dermacoccus abyssi]
MTLRNTTPPSCQATCQAIAPVSSPSRTAGVTTSATSPPITDAVSTVSTP